MGVVQQIRDDRNEPNVLTLADLARIPDSLEDVTSEWFDRQRASIEKKIRQLRLLGHSGVEAYETRRLYDRIERLRVFTDGVLRSRASESALPAEVSEERTVFDSREASEAVRRSEEHVERLLAQRKKDREFSEYLKSITG